MLAFGLNQVYQLVLGPGSDLDDMKMMQMQMGMGMMVLLHASRAHIPHLLTLFLTR